MKIIFCRECLYSSTHPLGITFDDTGLCSGCLIHKEKFHLDWNDRWKKLKQIIKLYKSKKYLRLHCSCFWRSRFLFYSTFSKKTKSKSVSCML